MINTTKTGAPNVVCGELRDEMRAAEMPGRLAAHLDAALERIVHAYAGAQASVTVTLVVTETVFSVTFA